MSVSMSSTFPFPLLPPTHFLAFDFTQSKNVGYNAQEEMYILAQLGSTINEWINLLKD